VLGRRAGLVLAALRGRVMVIVIVAHFSFLSGFSRKIFPVLQIFGQNLNCASAMESFIRNFVRDGEGCWRCVSPAELQIEVGRIQVAPGTTFTKGTMFMGLDVAAMLDEHHQLYSARV